MPTRLTFVATATLAILLAACGLSPSSTASPNSTAEYRPDVVGIVTTKDLLGDLRIGLVLATGKRLEIDTGTDLALLGTDPDEGDLFFYGSDPDPWYYALRPGEGTERCSLNGLARERHGELYFDFGLVLPVARDFDPGSGNFRRPGGSFFCVNQRGEVTRLYE